jgi:hypothetical protein
MNKEGAEALPYDIREKLTTILKFASIISVDFSHSLCPEIGVKWL